MAQLRHEADRREVYSGLSDARPSPANMKQPGAKLRAQGTLAQNGNRDSGKTQIISPPTERSDAHA